MGVSQFATFPLPEKEYVHEPRIWQKWRIHFPVFTLDGFHLLQIL